MTKEDIFGDLYSLLDGISSLGSFYIGKSSDVERREKEHFYKEGYTKTIKVVHSDAKRIAELEKYLIEKFNKSDLRAKCDNKQLGGGSEGSDCLYLSLRLVPKTMGELDDEDINWNMLNF